MAIQTTKKVSFMDTDTGKIKHSILPVNAPDEDAPFGVPIGLDFSHRYPEPFNSKLIDALAQRGIVDWCDLKVTGAADLVRQAIQQVLKMDTQDLIYDGHERCK